jgi:hypothetical protein
MSKVGTDVTLPPRYRGAGVLLHIASLPSPYGIGDVGPAEPARARRRELAMAIYGRDANA